MDKEAEAYLDAMENDHLRDIVINDDDPDARKQAMNLLEPRASKDINSYRNLCDIVINADDSDMRNRAMDLLELRISKDIPSSESFLPSEPGSPLSDLCDIATDADDSDMRNRAMDLLEPRACNFYMRRIVVFTEYSDTCKRAARQLLQREQDDIDFLGLLDFLGETKKKEKIDSILTKLLS